MSQPTTFGSFTSGPKTPVQVATQQNETFDALLSGHVGTSRPAYAVANTVWWKDTGASPKVYEQYVYDGVADVLMGTLDVAAGTWTSEISNNAVLNAAQTFTKTQTWTKGADVASASSLSLGDGNIFDITGTTPITAIATKGIGTSVKLHFDAALTLTHHATNLVLPGGANIITAAGDEAEFYEYASGQWRCSKYQIAANAPGTGGSVIDIQTFTSSGTWNKPSSGSTALVECWGGGGSGGRGSTSSGAAGGGGGGYNFQFFDLSTLGASETVTIGAGGAAQTSAGTAGNAGGNTTFGAHLTAYGGGAGGPGESGGGGGGGQTSAGGNGGAVSGAGGGPVGGPALATTIDSTIAISGGSGGASGTSSIDGGDGIYGGGGGAGGYSAAGGSTKTGGNSLYGGGGGGSGATDTSGGAGGASVYGGNGGAGGYDAVTGTAGTQPGGGGGGSEVADSGAGADGQVKVTVW